VGSHCPILACILPLNQPAPAGPFQRLVEWLGYEYDPWFAGPAAALVALGVLVPAWWWLRSWWWQRRHVGWVCPGCTYDLRGVANEAAFPFRCAECGLEINSQRQLTKTRRGKRLLAIAVVLFAAAHYTALGPEVKRHGWVRLVPATALVLQPMDVAGWTTSHVRDRPLRRLQREMSRRLKAEDLWWWQEWMLAKRVEHACSGQEDYGITPAQYDMAVRLHTTPARAWDEETRASRLTHLAATVDVPFVIDWESLSRDRWRQGEVMQPARMHATAADVLEELLSWRWPYDCPFWWDITPEGVVVAGRSRAGSTTRTRIYEVSDVRDDLDRFELIDLIIELIEPECWLLHGGSVGTIFPISDCLVIIATTRVHFEIEDLLDDLREATAPEATMPAHPSGWNGRAFTIACDRPTGMLDHLRGLRVAASEWRPPAGPAAPGDSPLVAGGDKPRPYGRFADSR
jgi:hypothetical protein